MFKKSFYILLCTVIFVLHGVSPTQAIVPPGQVPNLTSSSKSTAKQGETIIFTGQYLALKGMDNCTRFTNPEKTRYEIYECPYEGSVKASQNNIQPTLKGRPNYNLQIINLNSTSVTVKLPTTMPPGDYSVSFFRRITEEDGKVNQATTGNRVLLKVMVRPTEAPTITSTPIPTITQPSPLPSTLDSNKYQTAKNNAGLRTRVQDQIKTFFRKIYFFIFRFR